MKREEESDFQGHTMAAPWLIGQSCPTPRSILLTSTCSQEDTKVGKLERIPANFRNLSLDLEIALS